MAPKLLDLCCGRLGWSKAFLARGWECVGVDLVAPPEIPPGFTFRWIDLLDLRADDLAPFDFVCASTPCEQFSVHGMKHFHPNPPYPDLAIKLFNHARAICEASGVPYVMENVRAAQQFVGHAKARCGSFHLWGSGIAPLMPQGIKKGASQVRRDGRYWNSGGVDEHMYRDKKKRAATLATIPPELSAAMADYAQRLVFDFGEARKWPRRKRSL